MYEDGAHNQISDVIVFNRITIDGQDRYTLDFYSDHSDGVDSLADLADFPGITSYIAEERLREDGIIGFFGYMPQPGDPYCDPGYLEDPDHPGQSLVTYDFISDYAVPEPTTLITGALLLIPLGVGMVRKLRRNLPA